MLYFDHDTGASTDPKIMQLRLEHGGAAVDAYWYLIEQMHRDERGICISDAGALRVHCHTLCTDVSTLEKWVEAMVSIGLMKRDETSDSVVSKRAQSNIDAYKEKREKASSAAKSRWSDANAKQTHKRTQSKRNADGMPIKEKKRNSSNAIKSITTTNSAVAAAAAKAAPPAGMRRPTCPECGTLAWRNTQIGKWECSECRVQFTDETVRWA